MRCQRLSCYDHAPNIAFDQKETHCETSRLDDRRCVRRGRAWAVAVGLRPDAVGTDGSGHARPQEILRGVHLRSGRLQAVCRRTRWPVRRRTPTTRAVGAAAIGTVLGAGLGAAIGGGRGAAIGAGSGAIAGTGFGMGSSANDQYGIQQQYDNAFAQCMYSKGNMVPGYGPMMVNAPPPPPPGPDTGLTYAVQTQLIRLGYLRRPPTACPARRPAWRSASTRACRGCRWMASPRRRCCPGCRRHRSARRNPSRQRCSAPLLRPLRPYWPGGTFTLASKSCSVASRNRSGDRCHSDVRSSAGRRRRWRR